MQAFKSQGRPVFYYILKLDIEKKFIFNMWITKKDFKYYYKSKTALARVLSRLEHRRMQWKVTG